MLLQTSTKKDVSVATKRDVSRPAPPWLTPSHKNKEQN